MGCSSWFCSWTITCYSLHCSTKLSHTHSQLGPPPMCTQYTDLPCLGYPGYKLFLKPTQGLSPEYIPLDVKVKCKQIEFLIGTLKRRCNLDCLPTPMLSQNFTPAVSARNLGVTFDYYFILYKIFHKLLLSHPSPSSYSPVSYAFSCRSHYFNCSCYHYT